VLIHAAGGGVSSAQSSCQKMGATVLARPGRTGSWLRGAPGAITCSTPRTPHRRVGAQLTGGRGVDMVFIMWAALWRFWLHSPPRAARELRATTGPRVTLELGQLHLLGLQILVPTPMHRGV